VRPELKKKGEPRPCKESVSGGERGDRTANNHAVKGGRKRRRSVLAVRRETERVRGGGGRGTTERREKGVRVRKKAVLISRSWQPQGERGGETDTRPSRESMSRIRCEDEFAELLARLRKEPQKTEGGGEKSAHGYWGKHLLQFKFLGKERAYSLLRKGILLFHFRKTARGRVPEKNLRRKKNSLG